MIVYGDRSETVRTEDALPAIGMRLRTIETMPPGLGRHAALAGALIRLAQIVQGVADADFDVAGVDRIRPAEGGLIEALIKIARALIASWDGSFETLAPLPNIPSPTDLPEVITLRTPEGYAFYALYPEAYAVAARSLELEGPVRVIGIRSIGTALAAIVAAALDAPPPFTVRPKGHPFERSIEIEPNAAARLLEGRPTFLIVDEGPGLSGSSFASVAFWLESRGVARERIVFLPSHGGGPGAQARPEIQRCWAEVRSEPAPAIASPERVAEWAAAILGPLDAPLEDISGGAWRRRVFGDDEARWPAINPFQERLKFIARAQGKTWLVKFAGLGDEGERKLCRARILSAAGLVPEVAGLAHGFLIERWTDGRPLACPAPHALPAVARYLSARALLLPSEPSGASLERLFEMAEHNIGSELGPDMARLLRKPPPHSQQQVVPMAVDGRCDAHEWLQRPDGSILKADALDHDAAHDLIGAQDLAWDAAGAIVELGLDADEARHLLQLLDRAAPRPVSRELLDFLMPCYLAFRLGGARLAEASLGNWDAEANRNAAAAERYRARLQMLLGDE